MIRFQANPDRTLSAMPLRRQHQRPLDAGGSGGRRIVKRLINTARSPEDSPQVVNLHEPDSCKGPADGNFQYLLTFVICYFGRISTF